VQQLRTLWLSMNARKRAVVIVATLGMFAAILGLTRLASTPSMTLLYAGLEAGAAGDVVRALEARGASYRVRGDSILVDSAMRDELRMTLASEGLPANGGRGYELLDTLSGFGTTSQMFDAAYWRAKEGELARTIVAAAHIGSARVHIANSGGNPFARSAKPTASVMVTPSGGPLSAGQAKAIRFLVASAVAGLLADDVAVIDSSGALLGVSDDAAPTPHGQDRAEILKDRVQRLVEARVGQGNAIVEISVDTVTEKEMIRERRFDPESRVVISSDTEERSNASSDRPTGVSVASNLPDGDGAAGNSASEQTSQTRERVNYEVSETEREIIRAPGAIRRLSVAVLVNGSTRTAADGSTIVEPRPEDEIEALRDLVSSAVGFDEARGDVITIRSMDLPAVAPLGTGANSSVLSGIAFDAMRLIQIAVLAVVTLILGLFVVRPILAKPATALPPPPPAVPAAADMDAPPRALTGEITNPGDPGPGAAALALQTGSGTDPVDRLRAMIGERQEETVAILRSWLEDEEETV
jgi:flagellar M-ring protein FliF